MQLKSLMFWVFGIALLAPGILVLTGRAVAPKDAAMESVLAETERGGYRVINAHELWERYQKEPGKILLVDTRQAWEYRAGHIKGALHFSMEPTWWSRWKKRDALRDFLGPDKDLFMVFY